MLRIPILFVTNISDRKCEVPRMGNMLMKMPFMIFFQEYIDSGTGNTFAPSLYLLPRLSYSAQSFVFPRQAVLTPFLRLESLLEL